MGCRGSKEGRGNDVPLQARPRPNISGPVDPPGMIPRQRRDQRGAVLPSQQHDLSQRNITRALGYVAEFLQSRRRNMTLVAVGGAVNTVLLQTRNSTHDVDFFSQDLRGSEASLLREAVVYAEERSSVPLGDRWLNNETGTIGGTREQIPQLVTQATQQRDIVFQQPGLTIYAAPWNYAFVTKVGRITYGTGRTYDWDDAIVYLHQHIRRHGHTPVPVSQIRRWGAEYRRNTPDEILRQIDERYYRQYRQHGVDFNR